MSNFATIPIAASGQNFCSDNYGLTSADFNKLLSGGTLSTARLDLDTVAGNNASAMFQQWNFSDMIMSHGLAGGPSLGSCTVYNVPSGNGIVTADPFGTMGLNAGSQITVSGPGGTKAVPETSQGIYKTQLSAKGAAAFLAPGTYTMSNGSGGSDIGAFSVSVPVPQTLVWTNESTTKSISRSQPLTITWSGGGSDDVISIIGITGLASIRMDVEFFCSAQAGAGRFTIPAQVFALIPADGIESNQLPGMDFILGLVSRANFAAPNLDYGFVFSNTAVATILAIN